MTVDLEALASRVGLPDETAQAEVRSRVGTGGGRLGDLAVWLAGAQGRADLVAPQRVRLVVLAGDRTDDPSSDAAAHAVAPAVASTAHGLDVALRVVAAGSGRPLGPEPVCTPDAADAGLAAGAELADALADEGADLLVVTHVGAGGDLAAAALGVLLADLDVTTAVDRSLGDAAWVRDVPAVRDATRRARPLAGDRIALLAEVAGADLAALTGLLLGTAARRTPVVLDGPAALACALLAHRVAYRAAHWWLAPDTGTAPVAVAALERLGLEPLADLRLPGPPGLAGLLAVPLLRAAAGI